MPPESLAGKVLPALLGLLVAAGGILLLGGGQPPVSAAVETVVADTALNPAEAAMYGGFAKAMTEAPRQAGARERSYRAAAARRAYPGAPPAIPHPAGDPQVMADGCLSCHGTGGFAPAYGTYAPITPHPTYENCGQCHVPAATTESFRANLFARSSEPQRNQRALLSSPPVMPHPLQLRENCQACHVGPAAYPEVRVTHGERSNCRQCHVPQHAAAPFPPEPQP